MRNLPPLSGLEAFEAAARHLSFTEAAKELNCTQAAISQRVRGLEAYLSRQLFVRRRNGLQLSEVGEAYLPGVAEALNLAAAATEGLRGKNVPRTVTVSAPISFLNLWLANRFGSFLSDNPNVSIRLNSAIWTDPNAELADIVVEVHDVSDLDPHTPHLPTENLELVCAPALIEQLSTTTLQNVMNASRKIFTQGRHSVWERWATDLGINLDGDIPAMKVDNSATALEAAAQNLGFVVAYSSYCQPYLESGRLVSWSKATVKTTLCLALTGSPDKPLWHPAHKVFGWLKHEFEKEASST
ncbi:LysR family transcriptional regulator [Bradyrhizobium iriomotense]|uniref:LysR family transcriptional regulator n=1 Tax=Bradyrhizobium iriomotense TaxID=441950 RepID=UPI0024E0D41D|nr:LysR family transcriptional regulator [Bradyrhizobium iriomotense]